MTFRAGFVVLRNNHVEVIPWFKTTAAGGGVEVLPVEPVPRENCPDTSLREVRSDGRHKMWVSCGSPLIGKNTPMEAKHKTGERGEPKSERMVIGP